MVREARRDDASRIAEILVFVKRSSYRSIFRNDVVSFGEIQVLPLALHYLNDENALDGYYVYDDGIVKGALNIRNARGADGSRALEIVELYVESCFQGCGVGRALINHAMKRAELAGAESMFLWVLKKNYKAREFYERCGFAFTGEEQPEAGAPELLMRYQRLTGGAHTV